MEVERGPQGRAPGGQRRQDRRQDLAEDLDRADRHARQSGELSDDRAERPYRLVQVALAGRVQADPEAVGGVRADRGVRDRLAGDAIQGGDHDVARDRRHPGRGRQPEPDDGQRDADREDGGRDGTQRCSSPAGEIQRAVPPGTAGARGQPEQADRRERAPGEERDLDDEDVRCDGVENARVVARDDAVRREREDRGAALADGPAEYGQGKHRDAHGDDRGREPAGEHHAEGERERADRGQRHGTGRDRPERRPAPGHRCCGGPPATWPRRRSPRRRARRRARTCPARPRTARSTGQRSGRPSGTGRKGHTYERTGTAAIVPRDHRTKSGPQSTG